MSRREMLLASLGLLVAGCSPTQSNLTARPGASWPGASRPSPDASTTVRPRRSVPASPTTPSPPSPADPFQAIARHRWASAGPVAGRVNPMNGVSRITIHHEGWTQFWATDAGSSAARIEQIRAVHVRDRGWGDIGYHYVIDRGGRVWQARDARYQGAHVSGNNEHNLGIMLLGNFDEQRPSEAQLDAMIGTLRTLMRTHNVPTHRVHTHQELSPSACPGLNLQPRMVSLRRGGQLA